MRRAVIFLAVLFTLPIAAAAQSDTQQILARLRANCLNENIDTALHPGTAGQPAEAELPRHLDDIRADGSWADIDYASRDPSVWPPSDHLTRVLTLLVHAREPDATPADAARSLAVAHRAMSFWIAHDFQCPNWWYNQIGVPNALGKIALLFGDDITDGERNYILNIAMVRSKVGAMTGENRIWLASNGLVRGALMNDDALVRAAAAVIEDEIQVTTDEGIQPDWSFHQHGPQQQFGNYGMSCAVELSRWASVFQGTAYAFSNQQLRILRSFLLRGEAWVAWRGTMDIGSCGRQFFPNSPRSKAGSLLAVMRTMSVVDLSHTKDYLAFVARNADSAIPVANDLVGDTAFWRSDYVIHRRPDWMASIKMHSSRVIGGESINGENLSGAQLADGSTFFYQTGHEYDDIFPLWDWRKIPGTTELQTGTTPVWIKKTNQSTEPAFVGGVSDGLNGCAAMDFHRDGIQVKKAWFLRGDVMVCLGADITCADDSGPVMTTVNQCLLDDVVTVHDAGGASPVSGAWRRFDNAKRVHQGGFDYVFPQAESLLIDAEARTGNWARVFKSASTPKADATKNVFALCIDHGVSPRGASYAYYVMPDGGQPEHVTILSNSSIFQAVEVSDDKTPIHWIGIVFWSAGSGNFDGMPVTVDHPCLLLLRLMPNGCTATLADPTHKLSMLGLTIGGKAFNTQLPQNVDAGAPFSLVFAR
jgi:chondroitin AC lyase